MFLFRVVALFVLGVMAALAFSDLFKGSDTNFAVNMAGFILFSAFILVLGPFWPSQENIEKWGRNSKFNLPTDNRAVALYVGNFLAAVFALCMAWDRYTNPTTRSWRLEKLAFVISGQAGVVATWLIVAIGCLTAGVVTYKKARQAKKT